MVNALFGKEFVINEGLNILRLNGRFSCVGGERRSPVDRLKSQAQEDVVFDSEQTFSDQFDNRFIVDLTVTYRINWQHFSSVWALQVKNLFFEKDPSFDYNFKENRFELIRKGARCRYSVTKLIFNAVHRIRKPSCFSEK